MGFIHFVLLGFDEFEITEFVFFSLSLKVVVVVDQETSGAWLSSKRQEMQGEIRECVQVSQEDQRRPSIKTRRQDLSLLRSVRGTRHYSFFFPPITTSFSQASASVSASASNGGCSSNDNDNHNYNFVNATNHYSIHSKPYNYCTPIRSTNPNNWAGEFYFHASCAATIKFGNHGSNGDKC